MVHAWATIHFSPVLHKHTHTHTCYFNSRQEKHPKKKLAKRLRTEVGVVFSCMLDELATFLNRNYKLEFLAGLDIMVPNTVHISSGSVCFPFPSLCLCLFRSPYLFRCFYGFGFCFFSRLSTSFNIGIQDAKMQIERGRLRFGNDRGKKCNWDRESQQRCMNNHKHIQAGHEQIHMGVENGDGNVFTVSSKWKNLWPKRIVGRSRASITLRLFKLNESMSHMVFCI